VQLSSRANMGPPKRRPKRTPYSEIKRRNDCFEYRWNIETQGYYLFNPWTGETIFDTNLELLDRGKSMWAMPDRFPSSKAQNVMLYPEFYGSRRWGRRRFNGWSSEAAAAIHITAVGRGFLARQALRRYYRERFFTKTDQFSGYFYFVDRMNPDQDTTWWKPILAFPNDILPLVEDDPEDYMKGKKYSRQDFTLGPIFKVSGLNKSVKSRAKLEAFYAENSWKQQAVKKFEDIDMDQTPVGSVIAWMDGEFASSLRMSPFNMIRTALTTEGWGGVLRLMKASPDDIVIQLYGYHSFGKTHVPIDVSGLLAFEASQAMEYCVGVVKDEHHIYPPLLKVFALEALHNILYVRAGRLEYIDTSQVPEQGELRQAAVEKFLEKKFSIFIMYLKVIPNETVTIFTKGEAKPETVKRPLQRSIDVIEGTVKCLCLLSQEIETKEQLSMMTAQPIMFALQICQEEAIITLYSLQLMYNLCYRCEHGFETILMYCNTNEFFARVRHHHSGDPEVMHQCRRLELALQPFGWRGHVEEAITKEMMEERAESKRRDELVSRRNLAREAAEKEAAWSGEYEGIENSVTAEEGDAQRQGGFLEGEEQQYDNDYQYTQQETAADEAAAGVVDWDAQPPLLIEEHQYDEK